jgi:hypothetical protein
VLILVPMAPAKSPRIDNEAEALAELEGLLWPQGPVCPHCGERRRLYALEGVRGHNGTTRRGLRKCGLCRRQFTFRTGSVLARSHVLPSKWLEALRLVARDGGELNPHRLHRLLGVTYRTAVLIKERLAAGFKEGSLAAVTNSSPAARRHAAASQIIVFGRITFGGNERVAADAIAWTWAGMRDRPVDSFWVV